MRDPIKYRGGDHFQTAAIDFKDTGKREINLDRWLERQLKWNADAERVAYQRLSGLPAEYPPLPVVVATTPLEDMFETWMENDKRMYQLEFISDHVHVCVPNARLNISGA